MTTTTKIAGEAMTDAEIREIAARIYGTEATEQEIRFAAALLASKSVHLSKDEAATWVEQLKALYETDCGFDTGWRMACERVITYLNDASAVLASGASLPEGWKLVPVELTEHMLDEADFAMQNHVGDAYTDADGFDGWYQPVWKAILAASPTAPAQSCGDAAPTYAEFGTARERFISGAPVQASEHVLELARQALAARDSDTRTDDEKIAAAVDFICDTRLDQPVKCGDAEQADERNDGEEAMQAAAATLPAAYDLRIYLERGAGWVELYDPDGKPVEFDEDTDSGMAGSIRAATAEAIEHARAKDSK